MGYHVVGFVGYMRFGSKVEPNILASIGIAGSLMCGMSLVMWPLRSCTISVWRAARASSVNTSSVIAEPSNTEWRTTTVALLSAVLIAARLVPDIKKVMGLGSAVGMAFIIFIYP